MLRAQSAGTGLSNSANIGQLSGSLSISLDAGSTSSPKYEVAGISVSQEPVYEGAISSVSSNTVTFASETDLEGTSADPFANTNFASGTVRATAVLSGNGVGSITVVSGGSGLTAAPTVTIDDPETGTSSAEFTATVAGGVVTGFTQVSAGAGYSSAPSVTVDSGPHLLRLTSGDNEGRFFLIASNTATAITIDTSSLTASELGAGAAGLMAANDTVEIVRATTLGDALGAVASEFGDGTNDKMTSGTRSSGADWVYLWDVQSEVYLPYYFNSGTGRFNAGWYGMRGRQRTPDNDIIVYPDESFIIARRNNAAMSLSFDGVLLTTDTQLKLPAAGKRSLMTNPFGGDILLTELLPSSNVGTGNSQFYPTNDPATSGGDLVYVLDNGSWSTYYHLYQNLPSGTPVDATCSAIRMSGNSVSGIYIAYPNPANLTANGAKTTINAMTNAAGSPITVTTDAAHGLETGDIITIAGASGYKTKTGDPSIYLDEDGNEVQTTGDALQIDTVANGSWTITKLSASTFTIPKVGNAQYIMDSGYWYTATSGSGYCGNGNGTAKVYFVGNGVASSSATVTVTGGKIDQQTVTSISGSGNYGGNTPQAIFSTGSWRKEGAGTTDMGNHVIGGGAGIMISRAGASGTGVETYLKAYNPVQ
ncbi:MAG: hypothetical protein CMI31_11460 [Opitutae bacterium]|nr:hypothetical protein [Opitutae bacterium]